MNRRRAQRSFRSWYLYLFAAIAIASIAFGVSELGTATGSTTRTSTEVVTAASGVVQTTVSGSGNVEPTVDDAVNFATSGTLKTIDVKVGQRVKKGQLIATLDPSSAELTLQEAEETLTAANDSLTEAEDGTTSTSSGSGSSKSTTTTTSASAIEQAKAQVESDESTVTADEKAVDETKLYSPVTGTIASTAGDAIGSEISGGSSSSSASTASSATSAASSTGSSTTSSSGFVTVINSKTLTMTVSLSEDDISSVKVGQIATVDMTALSGVELAAKVTSISPLGTESDDVTSYDVTVTTTQSNAKVLPGMSATAEIVTGQQQGVTLPTEAISRDTVELYKNGKTSAQAVTVGLEGTSRAVITSGLKAGQEVEVTVSLPSLGTSTTSTTSTTSGFPTGAGGGAALSGTGGAGRFGGGAP
jgi:macrolide-specific efflux system membrane fusion protein